MNEQRLRALFSDVYDEEMTTDSLRKGHPDRMVDTNRLQARALRFGQYQQDKLLQLRQERGYVDKEYKTLADAARNRGTDIEFEVGGAIDLYRSQWRANVSLKASPHGSMPTDEAFGS